MLMSSTSKSLEMGETEEMELEEKIKDLFAEPSQYFHNGKYYNSIRIAYQYLLCMGFSILGIEMTQLPKTTFSSYTF